MCDAIETQLDYLLVEGCDGEDVLGSKLRLHVLFMKNEDINECTCLSNAKSVDIANYELAKSL